MKNTIYILAILVTTNVFSQLYKKHDWKDKPMFYQLTADEKKLPSIAIKEKHLIQYYKPLLGQYELYETKHQIIRVNNDKGIKKHNRVYIPLRNVYKVIDIKARVLHEDGKIITLNKHNIKELKDVKKYGRFKIFAIEGVEKNTQLEVIYTLNKRLSTLGNIIVQHDYKIKNAEVIIRKPFGLTTKVKSYNDFPHLIEKKVPGNKIAYTATATDIPAMVDEPYSTYNSNRMKVVYLTKSGGSNITSEWLGFTNRIQSNFLNIKPKKFKSLIADFNKHNTVTSDKDSLVTSITDYVTNNFNIVKDGNPFEDLKIIYSQKRGTDASIMKVYSCLFNHFNINYDVVFTSNRYYNKFDKYFFTNTNLNYIMFYLPDHKTYLCPAEKNPNLKYPPVRFSNNNGVFISKNSYSFDRIPIAEMEYTSISRSISSTIHPDDGNVTVKGVYKTKGYRGNSTRMAYKHFKKEDINKFKSMEVASGIEDADFSLFEVSNDDLKLSTSNTPVIIAHEYNSEEILEEVNDNFIFSVGRLIGTQSELYQEEERVNPVELSYPMAYSYEIKVNIPEGYRPTNLDELNSDVSFETKEGLGGVFKSKYTVENDTIIITISEKYPQVNIDKSYYEAYKDVINAAYDFSKKAILFEVN